MLRMDESEAHREAGEAGAVSGGVAGPGAFVSLADVL